MMLRCVVALVCLAVTSHAQTVAQLAKRMTLRDKIAQLILVVSNGDVFGLKTPEYEKFRHYVQDLHVGGLIVNNSVEFGIARNAEPHAMALFLNQMQKLARTPLLVGADFEQGAAMRVQFGTPFPHNMAIGATRDPEAAKYEGEVTARQARALGVHWVFAPVADVNNNAANPVINNRSFGEDPTEVAKMVAAFIDGAHSDKSRPVLVTAKHFPGHGDTDVDSHLGLAKLGASRERMDQVELKPFQLAIAHGADAIMTAHMTVPALEPEEIPATVSPKVLTGLLRNELKFKGLIVTDAMDIKTMGSRSRRP